MANKAGCGVIVHPPTSKAQSLPPSQRLLHPLLPFLAHTSRPESSITITLMNSISNGTKLKHITTQTHTHTHIYIRTEPNQWRKWWEQRYEPEGLWVNDQSLPLPPSSKHTCAQRERERDRDREFCLWYYVV